MAFTSLGRRCPYGRGHFTRFAFHNVPTEFDEYVMKQSPPSAQRTLTDDVELHRVRTHRKRDE